MHSPFNGASAAFDCTACSLEVPGFLRPVVVGRVSGQVVVELKLPVTTGWDMGDASGNGAWKQKQGLLETEAGFKYMHTTVLQQ